MALEAVVFPQGLFGYAHNLVGGSWSCEFGIDQLEDERSSSFESFEASQTGTYLYDQLQHHYQNLTFSSSPEETADCFANNNGLSPEEEAPPPLPPPPEVPATVVSRPKRRRVKCRKNKEDIETQRMTHIAVERNRRKQMNEYLSVLRSLMPDSYVQRGDQASIVGGAINFVKELEQRLQFLGTLKPTRKEEPGDGGAGSAPPPPLPFSEFFTFPQYSTAAAAAENVAAAAIADVEVTMVESHANIQIRTRRRRKQLVRMVSELQSLKLTILHLNVTTVDQIVLYCLSVKVEDECRLSSVDEIATAVHQLLGRIQEEAILNI